MASFKKIEVKFFEDHKVATLSLVKEKLYRIKRFYEYNKNGFSLKVYPGTVLLFLGRGVIYVPDRFQPSKPDRYNTLRFLTHNGEVIEPIRWFTNDDLPLEEVVVQ